MPCAPTQWPARGATGSADRTSEIPELANLAGLRTFDYQSQRIGRWFPDFVVGVSGAGDSWRVTYLSPDGGSVGMMSRLCALADSTRTTS